MIEAQGLSWYIPNRKEVAHIVKSFPETGKIYIFCNRTYVVGSGTVLNAEQFDAKIHSKIKVCDKCMTALEATVERMSIIQGVPPPERFSDWSKANPGT